MSDPFNLLRFLDAQQGIYETALSELRAGSKRSHWMWSHPRSFERAAVSSPLTRS
ncbi:MAG: DUF1810 family protein [Sphingomicrobium sp.]